MNEQIKQIASRLKGLREVLDLTTADVAAVCGIEPREYELMESGNIDIPVSILHQIGTHYEIDLTALMFGIKTGASQNLQPIPDAWAVVNILLLAVAPTVISNITLLLAVRYIGGTTTSVLGALEPVTAVCIGALIFGEEFTWSEAIGIALILIAVTIVILNRNIQNNLSLLIKRIRPRHA